MKRIKRIICIILAALIIVTAPITSYMEAKATEAVVTLGILDALYAMFGVSIGVGGQQSFFSQADLDYIITGARNGSVVQMGDYGEVDFSDSANVQRWLDSCAAVDGFLIGSASGNLAFGEDVAKQIRSNMLAIDMAAYKNTGTCASTALYDYITNFRVDTGDGLLDLQDACGLFSGDNDNDDNHNIDWTKYAAISALLSAALISKATDLKDYFSSLVKPDASEFTEYDAAFQDICFDGTYQTNANGHYVYKMSSSFMIVIKGGYSSVQWAYDTTSYIQIAGYYDNVSNYVRFIDCDGNAVTLNCLNKGSYSYISAQDFVGNIPVFSTKDAAVAALSSGDFSGAENLNDAYRRFKSNVHTAPDALKSALSKYFGKSPAVDDFISTSNSAVSALDANDGTTAALPAVADVLGEGITDGETDGTGDTTGTKDYTGILGKILSAINDILSYLNNPIKLVNAFASKFMTSDILEKLINNLPEAIGMAVANALDLPLVQPLLVAIAAIPGSIAEELVDVLPDQFVDALTIAFPRTDEIADSIIALPDTIADALESIDIKVPEIVVPDIVIPDIAVYPDITLDPTYEITVSNDYTGLDAIIAGAVAGVLTDLFVPDEVVTMNKITTMKSYFSFVDDMEVIITAFEKSIFGVKPSPYLKIPIGKPNSKYDYGTGNYIIIDVSWYAPYKDFGDKLILALMWAFFIWKIFVILPGIVSGSVGGFIMGKDIKVTNELNKYYADDSFRDQLNRYDSGFNGKGGRYDN